MARDQTLASNVEEILEARPQAEQEHVEDKGTKEIKAWRWEVCGDSLERETCRGLP